MKKFGYAFDQYARAICTIDESHRMAHDGFMYHASGKVTGLIDTGTAELLLSVPAATFPHLSRVRFDLGRGDVDLHAYEGTTTSADGTPISAFVTNRNSTNTPDLSLFSGPTVTGDGTLIHTGWVPPTATGTGLSADGVSNSTNGEEWLLKPSTKYLVRITNNSGATITYRYEILWYEIDNSQLQQVP
jgi:hypothetical protein